MVAPLVPISLSGRHSGFCAGLLPHTGPAWDSARLAGPLPFFIQNSDVLKLGLSAVCTAEGGGSASLAWFELNGNFPFFINIYSSCGCRVERFRVLVFN